PKLLASPEVRMRKATPVSPHLASTAPWGMDWGLDLKSLGIRDLARFDRRPTRRSSPTAWIERGELRIIELEGQTLERYDRPGYSMGSKQPRWGWQTCGLQKTSSGPSTVAVREHQYWPVGEASRRSTWSRPST